MKNLIKAAIVIQTLLLSAQASTIGWNADERNVLALFGATATAPLVLTKGDRTVDTTNDLLRLGFFKTLSDVQVAANFASMNFQAIIDDFEQIGRANVGDNLDFDGIWQASSFSTNTAFVGKRLHIWAFNAPTLAAADQWGISQIQR